MNQSRNGKKSNLKGYNRSKIEALKVTAEKKKECNSRALKIVTHFSEGNISESLLIENLQHINQEHYQDIVEERAINKLCGYPLCSNLLKNVPAKQYHISTTLNKVFDITDRKNFCSNLCYKASKYLKDQISTSPVWLRENRNTTSYKLLSLHSQGGISGEEVDLGVATIKVDYEELISNKMATDDDKMLLTSQSKPGISKIEEHLETMRGTKITEDPGISTANPEISLESVAESLLEDEKKVSNNLSNELNDHEELITISSSHPVVTQKQNEECMESSDPKESLTSITHETKSESKSVITVSTCNVTDSQKLANKSYKKSSKKGHATSQLKKKKPNVNDVVLKIERVLKEWMSIDSLCFIIGTEKIKEILTEKNINLNTVISQEDTQFYERYLAICKKLNIMELEESKLDATCTGEARKPLPDFEELKKKTQEIDIKVKMFYKGDKVKFEEADNDSLSADNISEPVLPLVDIHAQKAFRRRIVSDKLRRVLQDLQTSLGLRGFDLNDQVKSLISSFTLDAHNITMKPIEWNLIAICIIKLLSLKDKTLDQALNSSSANKYLTLLLMSYSLDAGYLDRLVVWLTDVESFMQNNLVNR